MGKVEVADGELRTFDVHWQIHLRTPGEVLDITVSSMFGAAGNCAGSLVSDFLFDFVAGVAAGVDVNGLRGFCDVAGA